MKILWVKAGGLVPPDTGGKIRSYNILRQLAAHHSVTFFTFYAVHEKDVHAELKDIFQKVICIPLDLPAAKSFGELMDYGARVLSRDPYTLTKFYRPSVQGELRRLLQQEKYDVIVCDFIFAATAIPWDWPCPKVLFTHNVEAVIWQRHYEVASNPLWKILSWREWKTMAASEERYLKLADHVLTVSDNDRDVFAKFLDPGKITVIPTGADIDFFSPSTEPETPNSLVFTGSMDWLPNEDGILFFIKEILPLVRRTVPDVSLSVVGRKPSRRLQDAASSEPNVKITGWVEDIRPYLAQAAGCIVPLRIGGGTRLKIYEAMSMAKAVISTSIGAEGLPVRDGEHLLLADSPTQFAASTVILLGDPLRRRKLGLAARDLVKENYSWGSVARDFAKVLSDVLRRSHTQAGTK